MPRRRGPAGEASPSPAAGRCALKGLPLQLARRRARPEGVAPREPVARATLGAFPPAVRTAMGPKRPKTGGVASAGPAVSNSWEAGLVSAHLEEVKAAEGQGRGRPGRSRARGPWGLI